ncbi:MAG: methyl-accepting chemotaxis protein, partial [Treponema sp.]|nr:methyl-accepting chemotaxis protein [Treponema sp.]
MRRISQESVEHELSSAIETMKLRLANAVNSELALAIKMADDPLTKTHFLHPENHETELMAFQNFAAYRRNFKNNSVFWINDIDKRFYFDDGG